MMRMSAGFHGGCTGIGINIFGLSRDRCWWKFACEREESQGENVRLASSLLASDLLRSLEKREDEMEEMDCHFLWLRVEEEKRIQVRFVLARAVWFPKLVTRPVNRMRRKTTQ